MPRICKNQKLNMLQAYHHRQLGMSNNHINQELLSNAEDRFVNKDHDELNCEMPGIPRSTFLMVFSPDGTKVASTHGNHNVYVTDLRTGKNINTLVGHPRTPWCIAFHPSSNQILATGCLGGQVRIWDLSGGSEVWTTDCQTVIASLAFHPIDRLLVIATFNVLYFWDWSQPKPFMQATTNNVKEKVRYVAFDRLGHKLITGIANMQINAPRFWERTRAPLHLLSQQPSSRATPIPIQNVWHSRRNTRPVRPASFSSQMTTNTGNQNEDTEVMRSEQERRIIQLYKSLIQRFSEVYRTRMNNSTMDRGTDPMEPVPLNQTVPVPSSSAPTISSNTYITVRSSTGNLVKSNNNSSSNNSETQKSPTTRSISPEPGPSGVQNNIKKRPRLKDKDLNATDSNSDSLSSDESSDESTVPKRRVKISPHLRVAATNSKDRPINYSKKTKKNKKLKVINFLVSEKSAFQPATPSASSTNREYSSESNVARVTRKQINSNKRHGMKVHIYSPKRENSIPLSSIIDRYRSARFDDSAASSSPVNQTPDVTTNQQNPSDIPLQSDANVPPVTTSQNTNSEEHSNEDLQYYFTPSDTPLQSNVTVPPSTTSQDSNSTEYSNEELRYYFTIPRENSNTTETSFRPNPNHLWSSRYLDMHLERMSSTQQNEELMSRLDLLEELRQFRYRLNNNQNGNNNGNREVPDFPNDDDITRRNRVQSPEANDRYDDGPVDLSSTPLTRLNGYTSVDSNANNITNSNIESNPIDPVGDHNYMATSSTRSNNDGSSLFTNRAIRQRLLRHERITAEMCQLQLIRHLCQQFQELLTPRNQNNDAQSNTQDQSNTSTRENEVSTDNLPNTSSNSTEPTEDNETERANENCVVESSTEPCDSQTRKDNPSFSTSSTVENRSDPNSDATNESNQSHNTSHNILKPKLNLNELRHNHHYHYHPPCSIHNSNDPRFNRCYYSGFAHNNPVLKRTSESAPREMNNVVDLSQHSSTTTENCYAPSTSSQNNSQCCSPLRNPFLNNSVRCCFHSTQNCRKNYTDNVPPKPRTDDQIDSSQINGIDSNPSTSNNTRIQFNPAEDTQIEQNCSNLCPHCGRQVKSTPKQSSSNQKVPTTTNQISNESTNSNIDTESEENSVNRSSTTSLSTDSTPSTSNLDLSPILRISFRKVICLAKTHMQKSRRGQPHCLRNNNNPRGAHSVYLRRQRSAPPLSYRRLYNPRHRMFYANQTSDNSSTSLNNSSNNDEPDNHENVDITPTSVMNLICFLEDLIRQQHNQPLLRFYRSPLFFCASTPRTENDILLRLNSVRLRLQRMGVQIDVFPRLITDMVTVTSNNQNVFLGRHTLSIILLALMKYYENPARSQSRILTDGLSFLLCLCVILTDTLLLNVLERLPPPDIRGTHGFLAARIRSIHERIETETRYFRTLLAQSLQNLSERSRVGNYYIEDLSRMSVSDDNNENSSTEPNTDETTDSNSQDQILQEHARLSMRLRVLTGRLVQNLSRLSPSPIASSQNPDTLLSSIQEAGSRIAEHAITRARILRRRVNNEINWRAGLVPQVQVNDVPVNDDPILSRPVRPPLFLQQRINSGTFRPRFLHPLYGGVALFETDMDDQQREHVHFGMDTDFPTSGCPNHRIQIWNISDGRIPCIANPEKNVVVSDCKIHNDASVDISQDGNLLVALLPSGGYLNITNKLGIFSIQWDNLGECLYTVSFEQNAVSVSLSATARYLAVGLASRRVSLVPGSERCIMAQLYKLEDDRRTILARDIEKSRNLGSTGINCIRWSPVPGQGLVYATNSGHLKVLT